MEPNGTTTKKPKAVSSLTATAAVAAIYAALCVVFAPLSFGPIQVRIAEALTLLPLDWKRGIAALTLGCFISNLLGVAMNQVGPIDIVFGTLATFLAALGTWHFRNVRVRGVPVLSILSPIVVNGVIVGIELAWILNREAMWTTAPVYGLQVAAGETIAVLIGWGIIRILEKRKFFERLP